MLHVLIELVLSNLEQQVLVHSITFHKALDSGRIHILVGPKDVSDVALVLIVPPCILNASGSLDTFLL